MWTNTEKKRAAFRCAVLKVIDDYIYKHLWLNHKQIQIELKQIPVKQEETLTKKANEMKTNLLIRKVSIFLIGILAVVLITNCNKTDNTTPQPGTSELSFNILAGKDPSGLKDGGTPGCIDANKSGNYVNVQKLSLYFSFL